LKTSNQVLYFRLKTDNRENGTEMMGKDRDKKGGGEKRVEEMEGKLINTVF
jgi:hypothetical protein